MAEEKRVESRTIQNSEVGGERINVQRVETVEKNHDGNRMITGNIPTAVKRISWAAVFAGVVITLVTQLLLSILGLGVGASTIDPLTEQNPANGVATGAVIWFVVSTLIALFAGGWVAGRLDGIPRATDALLHRVLTWGLATLLLFYFLTSSVGSLIGGTFRVLGGGLSAAATGAAAAAPSVAGAVKDQLQESGVNLDLSSLRGQVETLLRQTGKAELQPGAIQNQANQAVRQTQNTANQAASDPANSDNAVSALFDRLSKSSEKTFNAADRDALTNIIVARTGKSREEAAQTVASYEKTYQQAQAQYEQTKAQAAQKAREVGQKAAEGVAKAAIWAFIALLASGLAAAIGGYLATPRDLSAANAASANANRA